MYQSFYPIAGEVIISKNTNFYKQFQAPFQYHTTDIPDLCFLTISIIDTNYNSQANPGSSFLIDDLYFSEALDIDTRGHQNLPVEYSIAQNYPNPLNANTNINFKIPESINVSLII